MSTSKATISKKRLTFQNPFPEFRFLTGWELTKFMLAHDETDLPSDSFIIDHHLPISDPSTSLSKLRSDSHPNLVCWIGHATCLLKLDGVFILTDPVFSTFCSAVQIGLSSKTRRFREPGIPLEQIERLDYVVISHNHYDHLDYHSVCEIARRFPSVHWVLPLDLGHWMRRWVTDRNVKEYDWWASGGGERVTFTCVPAQHWSMRNPFDRNHSLWAGWVISSNTSGKSVYFAGDTGYNDRIFNQIGHHHGPFDLALIPIGAYKPREYLKCQHVDPAEAVKVHRETKSKLSVGIHWGTFQLGKEHYLAPKRDLEAEVEKAGIPSGEFVTLKHGETMEF